MMSNSPYRGTEHGLGELVYFFPMEFCHSSYVIVLSQFDAVHPAFHFGSLLNTMYSLPRAADN